VVQDAHQLVGGGFSELARPPPKIIHSPKSDAPMIAVYMNTRPIAPPRWSMARRAADEDPRPVELLEQGQRAHQRQQDADERDGQREEDARGEERDVGHDPEPADRDGAPEQQVDERHQRQDAHCEHGVAALLERAAGLRRLGVVDRLGARPAGDEEAAVVCRIRPHV